VSSYSVVSLLTDGFWSPLTATGTMYWHRRVAP